jgi:hypothetical protein
MAFAEGGDAEHMPEGVEGHDALPVLQKKLPARDARSEWFSRPIT